MHARRRPTPLDGLRHDIAEIEGHTAEVLAALDATIADLSASLEHPVQPPSKEAIADEIAAVRAELIAARAGREALKAELGKFRHSFETLPPAEGFKAMMADRREIQALTAEGEKQGERVALLEATLRELESSGAEPHRTSNR